MSYIQIDEKDITKITCSHPLVDKINMYGSNGTKEGEFFIYIGISLKKGETKLFKYNWSSANEAEKFLESLDK